MASSRMCAISDVVVVFPFDPVMPISIPCRNRYASSISLQTATLRFRAANSSGASAGTPGLGTIKSCSAMRLSPSPPNSSFTPAARNLSATPPTCASGRDSVAVTRAPRAAQNNAVATPVRARPITSTRLFFSSIAARSKSFLSCTFSTVSYRNFSVVSANNAKTSATIQNRTITFDSLQPINSK